MKFIYDVYNAVKFPEENMIFITKDTSLYFIYNCKHKIWKKHKGAGYDSITIENYPDVSKDELMEAMGGVFPTKETDLYRLCNPSELWIRELMELLEEDYSDFMSEGEIHRVVHSFLIESEICHVSYTKIRKLFDSAKKKHLDKQAVLKKLLELTYKILGRDIFKEEIVIRDGNWGSSYFRINPVRVLDPQNTDGIDSVAEMQSVGISIEEDDVSQFLMPFLDEYFDDKLAPNKHRVESYWKDMNGKMHYQYMSGFEWYLTNNFFTFDSIERVIKDMRETIDALSNGNETDYTRKLKERMWGEWKPELIVDFYDRFIYRMEHMIRAGKETGYSYISFVGP